MIELTRKIERIPEKIKFGLLGAPLIKSFAEHRYRRRLESFAGSIPPISEARSQIVDALNDRGVFSSSLQQFTVCPSRSLRKPVDQLMADLQVDIGDRRQSIVISQDHIIKYPEIYLWGIDESMLDIAENYLGLPVLYQRVDVRRDFAHTDTPFHNTQWHLDTADRRIIKLIIYLNDVSAGGGPFEYIPKDRSGTICQALNYRSGFVSDEAMQSLVPTKDWRLCTGSLDTIVMASTADTFHRIRAPVDADRLSITYSYTSRQPVRTFGKVHVSPQDVLAISKHLTERQIQCISPD